MASWYKGTPGVVTSAQTGGAVTVARFHLQDLVNGAGGMKFELFALHMQAAWLSQCQTS
jgi:hypothetical protein